MTQLEAFKREQGWNYERLARALGCSRSQAHKYCQPRGSALHSRISFEAARALEKLTHGRLHAGNAQDDISEVAP